MATKFLEPGGDATFNIATTTGFWSVSTGSGQSVATDFVHGSHLKSIKCAANSVSQIEKDSVMSDSGSRYSVYIYLNALPTATSNIININRAAGFVFSLRITSGGILQLWDGFSTTQIGSNGTTLSTGIWYRISLAYTITSTTVNRFELFVNGVSSISITNATLSNIVSVNFLIGNLSGDSTLDIRYSDFYIDNSSSLTDTGDVWVTAKRPNANGTTNGFTTQIGSGGSGYGSGHSPQVNERPLSNTNGWSVVAVAATTEEYNIESKSAGDIDISAATIVDYVGWVDCKSVLSETASIIVNNVSSNISVTSTETLFTSVAGSSTYPSGTGTDIGMVTSNTATTVSLYECGLIVAFIPATLTNTWALVFK